MSFIQKTLVSAIKTSLRGIECIDECQLGVFESNYGRTHKKPRRADLYAKTSEMYYVTQDTVFEIQGAQHYDPKAMQALSRNAPGWKNKFYDTVLRDRWAEKLLKEKEILLIRILPPPFNGNKEDYEKQIMDLAHTIKKVDYLPHIINKANEKGAHGVEIDYLGNTRYFINRNMTTPKLKID